MKKFKNIDWTLLGPLRKKLINPETDEPYTQVYVAKKAKCSQAYIARIEKGDMHNPKEVYVQGIADALRLTLAGLLQQLEKGIEDKPEDERPRVMQISDVTVNRIIPVYKQPYLEVGPHFKFTDGILLEGSEHIECPPYLRHEEDAYAVQLWDAQMEPRYRAGDILFVNPNVRPRAGEDAVIQIRHKSEDTLKHRWIGLVREIVRADYEYHVGRDGNSDAEQALIWAHNLEEKAANTYNGDFKSGHGYDPLEWYENKSQRFRMNDHGVNVHLVAGVQKVRLTMHYVMKAEGVSAGKPEVGSPEVTVKDS